MTSNHEQLVESGTAIDPVCGMTVALKTAACSFAYNGQSYYFCADHCLAKFRINPESFLNKSALAIAAPPVAIQRSKLDQKL